jgi:hypothetical protein
MRRRKEKELMNVSAIGVTGDSTNSSTRATEMVACSDIVPAFSCGSVSPSQDGTRKLLILATYYAPSYNYALIKSVIFQLYQPLVVKAVVALPQVKILEYSGLTPR